MIKRKNIICAAGLVTLIILRIIIANICFVKINDDYVFFNTQEFRITYEMNDDDLKDIRKLRNLRRLDIFGSEITSIEFLSEMDRLVHLTIASQSIKDFTPLKNCKTLKTLWLGHTYITDLKFIENCGELTYLELYQCNELRDISSLKYLTKLETLSIRSEQIKDISAIDDLPSLKTLELNIREINDISPVSSCLQLQFLNLYGCEQIDDISDLSKLNMLEKINLANTSVKDLSPLLKMENLKEVVISAGQNDPALVEQIKNKNITVKIL